MATTFTVTIICDERSSPDCHHQATESAPNPRRFDSFGTELFQQGWLRGFRNTNPAPDATSDTMVAYDVCPACSESENQGGVNEGG